MTGALLAIPLTAVGIFWVMIACVPAHHITGKAPIMLITSKTGPANHKEASGIWGKISSRISGIGLVVGAFMMRARRPQPDPAK